ncbi:MAG: PQQ-binding-like beta-propeller repeat protein [Dehalococcoidia bacterium]
MKPLIESANGANGFPRACMAAIAILAVALLAVQGPVPGARGQAAQNLDWPYYGNDPGGMRYADIDQISPSNVAQLQPAWIFHTNVFNEHTSFEAQPIVVDGVMYVSSPHDHVFALDAATGALKWTYNPEMPSLAELAICCGQANRGVAVGRGKVFIGQLDATLVALDAQTGAVAWKVAVADWRDQWTETMAPLYVDGKVIIGASGGEFLRRGFVDAYDADTGQQLWRFYTVPEPGQFGSETWAGDSWRTGGATVWSTPVADLDLGLLYITTGNAAPDENGSERAGDNLFSTSVVALDLATGQYHWHFQEVHHDLWDYDAAQPAHLFTLEKDGRQTPAIGHANKNGNYFILDRRTGEPLYDVTEVPVPTEPAWQNPSPTQPMPTTDPLVPQQVENAPPGVRTAPMWTPPQEQPLLIQPGFEAGPEWTASAYSPRTKYAYIQAGGYEPWLYHAIPPLLNSLGSTAVDQIPGVENWGLFDAVDTTTGKLAWQMRTPQKIVSGVVVAGDLVFFGESNGQFNALDATSGEILWSFKSDVPSVGGANGSPAVYIVDGREYVVMTFGGNNQVRSSDISPSGDAVIAFALPRPGDPDQLRVLRADPQQVETGAIPESAMIPPMQSPPADAVVVEVETHDFAFFPNEFVVPAGRQVAVHIVNTGVPPSGIAIKLPDRPIALKGPVKPGEDAYLVFRAPSEPGSYEFFSPLGPQRFFGMTGTMTVVAPAPAGTPAAPPAQRSR